MYTRSLILVLSILYVIATASAALGGRGAMLGSYRPIKDLNDPHVQEVAKYAISKHNELDGAKLQYVNVVKGESQVVAGTNYRLQISAKDGADSRDYMAVVYERPWENYRNLISFNSV